MTFNEKMAELTTALMKKAEELDLVPLENETGYSVGPAPVFQIKARFTDSESLKQQLRNESKQ